ncbi:TonB-dependent receptor [Novosphingobium sp. Leaf2]|uniref:TonB-dependent receptor n=1 Tax=Novosphingobium sp. Leaf2 TaxID=1735670 RepID=UPI0006FF28E0|nr:TonB-dependent receptor [Novosphingobium sp. Leaf2]KQM14753.1 TonB-dependent receptor [Novosphingobium sp. Leaf2]
MQSTNVIEQVVRLAISTSLFAIAATSTQAIAADASAPADTDAPQLSDIIVTGEKRETRLQDVPIAITAIDSSVLRQRNTNSLDDLDGYVPGLNIARNQGAERVITIRGIGYETSSNPNSQPGVAFHIDGVYIAHTMALGQDLIDVDRIEVLRGPQGTVFGETSTGGAINVITNKPKLGDTSGNASASYGNYNYVKVDGAVNVPLGPTLAARFAGQYLRHDGYGYSVGVPNVSKYALDDANNLAGRASLLWQPSSTFSALLEASAFHADHAGAVQKLITDTTPGARNVDQDLPATYKLDTRMVSLTLSQELNDTMVLKSVSAYQYMNKNQTSESDRTANPAIFDHLVRWHDRSKTFSQEVTLSSQNTSTVEWTLGGFFLRQRALQDILELSAPGIAAVVLPDGTGVKFQTDSPYQHTSLAGYGQAIFHASDALAITAGLRYSWDKVSAQPYQFYYLVPPRSAKSDALTGKISADYKLTPDNSIYVTASTGYKPTGVSFVSDKPFEAGSFSSGPQYVPQSFKKETVKALEIGSKNEFFDRRVRLNVAGYYYWYKNFQFTADDPVPFAGGTDNIPKAEVWGAEAEATFIASPALRFDGTFSWGKGKFTSDFLTIDAQTAAQVRAQTFAALGYPAGYYYDARIEAAVDAARENLNGKRLPKMPTTQGTFAATYTAALPSAELAMRGEVAYRGSYNYRVFANSFLDKVPSYTIFNASITYTPEGQPWRLALRAQNISNKAGIASRFSDPYGSGTTSVEYIPPRQVMGSVSVNF